MYWETIKLKKKKSCIDSEITATSIVEMKKDVCLFQIN